MTKSFIIQVGDTLYMTSGPVFEYGATSGGEGAQEVRRKFDEAVKGEHGGLMAIEVVSADCAGIISSIA